jgi:hypothetical protein
MGCYPLGYNPSGYFCEASADAANRNYTMVNCTLFSMMPALMA